MSRPVARLFFLRRFLCFRTVTSVVDCVASLFAPLPAVVLTVALVAFRLPAFLESGSHCYDTGAPLRGYRRLRHWGPSWKAHKPTRNEKKLMCVG